ncbi:TniQ family protein [Roseateles sp.]|uniref:TniQ family protein n=1 Tax=Roseateles sp. TaxID=1971397 RepID=UPI00326396AA
MVATDQGHPRGHGVTRPWALRVGLLPEELFSTWLVRAALAQGCDPMDLTGSLWPRWRAWTVDLDRGLAPERLAVLAARSGVAAAELEAAMLHPLLAAIAPGVEPSQATWPWILAQGSRNRRRQGGLQFCPACLAEDATPYFRRSWRLAWHVGCVRHGILLSDHCGRCHSPAEPHRVRASDVTLCRCPSCGHDLRDTATSVACAEALDFQRAADHVLSTGHGIWSAVPVTRERWFHLAKTKASGRLLGLPGDQAPLGVTSLALNLQRPSERVQRLRMALRGMNGQACEMPMVARGAPGGGAARLATSRPQAKVQGEWIRLLRRSRVGHA